MILLFASNLPTVIITFSINHSRELLNLAKIYIDNKKYSACNNTFIFKLAIFQNICSRANVSLEIKIKAFSIMLKSLSLDYYYSNISISGMVINFNQVC